MEHLSPEELGSFVLLDIALIVLLARLMGVLFRKARQPSVVAEIAAALILGPSLLGAFPGNPTEVVFPDEARPFLTVIATLGLVIFMFIVGLELDLSLIRGKGKVAATVSICSVVTPFTLGVLLAVWLHGEHGIVDEKQVDLLPFALFLGAAMSVTAFPVLARILTERGMSRIPTGALALACAAVDDVLAWTMLAVVLAVVQSSGPADLILMVTESAAFVAVMFWVVRPRLRSLVRWRAAAGRLTPDLFAIVLIGVLFSSVITAVIGIHAIFGAFLFGAIMPRDGAAQLSNEILERVEQLTVLVLLPVFFIITGLNVDIRALGRSGFVELLAVLFVACAGKFVGASLAARAMGIRPRQAGAIGVLMNARGLTELVILNIGRELGVLDTELFTIMVLMALITTAMTEPLLRLFYTDRMIAREAADAEREALGLSAEHRVVVLVDEVEAGDTVDSAAALLDDHGTSELVISRFDAPLRTVEVGSGLTSELVVVAESFETLQNLSDRASLDGASVVARFQFSEDVTSDLNTQLRVADADVVVLSSRLTDLSHSMLETADCAVVIAATGSQPAADAAEADFLRDLDHVAVRVGTDDEGLAAVELACRVAATKQVAVHLLTGDDRRERRRAAALHKRMSAAGVPAEVPPPGPSPAADVVLVVGSPDLEKASVPEDPEGYRAVFTVRSSRDDHGEALSKYLEQRQEAKDEVTNAGATRT